MEFTEQTAHQKGVNFKFTRTVLLASICAMVMIYISTQWTGTGSRTPAQDKRSPDPRKDTARLIITDSMKDHKGNAE